MPLILPRGPQRYLSGLSVHQLPTPSYSCPHRPRHRRRCSRPLLGTFSPRYISVVSGLPLSSSNGPSATVGGVLRRLSTPHRSRRHRPCSRPLLGTFPAQRTFLILGHPFSSSVYPVVCCRWLATRSSSANAVNAIPAHPKPTFLHFRCLQTGLCRLRRF